MAKVKKMALGGMGKTVMPGSRNTQTPVGSGFKPTRTLDSGMAKTVMPGSRNTQTPVMGAMKPLGVARGMKKGGSVSASKRADGIAQRGKTRA